MAAKPAHNVRLGNISGTIWSNTSQNGPVWYSTEIVRNYQVKDQWEKAPNFRLSDLPVVAAVSDYCLKWIMQRANETSPADGDGGSF